MFMFGIMLILSKEQVSWYMDINFQMLILI